MITFYYMNAHMTRWAEAWCYAEEFDSTLKELRNKGYAVTMEYVGMHKYVI